jgi:cysteine dioxygenase
MESISTQLRHQKHPDKILEILKEAGFNSHYCEHNKVLPQFGFPYGRNILHSDLECEIMLASWTPNLPCCPHNHGHSKGWIFYLKGDFKETIYEWESGELNQVGAEFHQENSHTCMDNDFTHSCMATKEGLSLHIYFPRIQSMRVHDLTNRRTLVVSDNCGAWIPEIKESIKEEISWPVKIS